jgi:DNA-binding SARP family transcriptional activator
MDVGSGARITLIDGFTVRWDHPGSEVAGDDLPHGVQRLVVHLCLAGRPTRSAVAGDLWPEVPEDQAHASLRSALWRARKVAPGLVEGVGGALSLVPGVRVDVRELDDWARRVADPGSTTAEVALPDLGVHGELLPGWYDDWVLMERERLRQVRLHALEALAGRLTAAGRFADALQAALLAVRAEPLRESAHRAVIRVHLAERNLGEALRAYEHFRRLLADELGVRPSEQMDRLVAGIARRPPVVPAPDHARRGAVPAPLRSVPPAGHPALHAVRATAGSSSARR